MTARTSGSSSVGAWPRLATTSVLRSGLSSTMRARVSGANKSDNAPRSTGVGTAVAVGRIGNILAVYVGGYALDQGGVPGYFGSWATLMALVFISLAVIHRHVPRSKA